MNKEIKIRSGDISVTAGRSGIRFDSGIVSIVGGNTDIAVSDRSNGMGITGGTVQIEAFSQMPRFPQPELSVSLLPR